MVDIELEQMFATDFERFGSMRGWTSIPERHLHRNRYRQIHGPVRVPDPRHAADHPKVCVVYVLNLKIPLSPSR